MTGRLAGRTTGCTTGHTTGCLGAGPDGFTLLEILVALAVFGLLLLGLSGGTRFGLRAWAVQERGAAGRGDVQAADRTLRRLLSAMAPGAEGDAPATVGDAHRMSFTTTLPAAAPAGGGTRDADVALGVAGGALVLRWTPHLHAVRTGPPPPPRQEELLPGVRQIDLAYWRQDAAGGWLAAWDGRELPALVRLHLVFADPARHWPDIVVAPVRRGAEP